MKCSIMRSPGDEEWVRFVSLFATSTDEWKSVRLSIIREEEKPRERFHVTSLSNSFQFVSSTLLYL